MHFSFYMRKWIDQLWGQNYPDIFYNFDSTMSIYSRIDIDLWTIADFQCIWMYMNLYFGHKFGQVICNSMTYRLKLEMLHLDIAHICFQKNSIMVCIYIFLINRCKPKKLHKHYLWRNLYLF